MVKFKLVLFIYVLALLAASSSFADDTASRTTSITPTVIGACVDVLTLPNRDLGAIELKNLAEKVGRKYKPTLLNAIQHARPSANGRVYVKVFENAHVTMWAIQWKNNQTEIHDHVRSQAGIYVVKGQIVEEFFNPPNPHAKTRMASEGESLALGGLPYVHRISGVDGVSLHIYSPPLTEMTFYDVDHSGALVSQGRWADDAP